MDVQDNSCTHNDSQINEGYHTDMYRPLQLDLGEPACIKKMKEQLIIEDININISLEELFIKKNMPKV